MALNVRRFSIEVFGATMLLHGVIVSFRRLSDLVNEPDPYLVMSEIQTYPYVANSMIGQDQHSHGLVNKDMIVMLADRDAAAPEAPAAVEMSVAKVPHRILVYTNRFAINADIHLAQGAELEQFLAASPGQFVPVTNATAMPTEQGTQLTSFRRHFLLINRDHIAYLGTADEGDVGAAAKDSETIG
jgi:hypothetical protein